MQKIIRSLKNLGNPLGIIGLCLTVAVPLIIYLLPKEILRRLDLYVPLPLFMVQTICIFVLVVFLFKDIVHFFKSLPVSKIYLTLVFLFVALVTCFAGSQIEARHRVQSDESIFMSVAQNMYHNQISGTCNQGEFTDGVLKCIQNSNSFKTKGLSYLYFLFMPFLGIDLHFAFILQLVALPFTILLFFFALLAWTRHASLSFLATVFLGVQPTLLFQFRSLSVEPLYILFFSLSLLVFRFAYEKNTWKHFLLAALILAFFAQTRQETVFCFLGFIFLVWNKISDSKSLKAPLFFFAIALFSIPVLITISYYQNFGFQGGNFSAHGHFIEDVVKNFELMTLNSIKDGLKANPFLAYFTYFFLAGLILCVLLSCKEIFKKSFAANGKILVFFLLIFPQTFMILENVSGDFSIEINQRYSLVLFPFMAFFAAYFFLKIFTFLEEKLDWKNFISVSVLILSVLAASYTISLKQNFNDNIMYRRNHLTTEETALWKWLKEKPDAERLFIYARPYHFISYGISSVHYNTIRNKSDSEINQLLEKYNGEVYYVRGLDCWDSQTYHKKAVETRIPTTCDVFEKEMHLLPEANLNITNSYRLEIKKWKGRKNYNKENVVAFTDFQNSVQGVSGVTVSLNETVSEPWKVFCFFDNKMIYEKPYQTGTFNLSLPADSLKGYFEFAVSVRDSLSGELIAEKREFLLYDSLSVVKLALYPFAFHNQGYGTLGRNKSIDGNALKVDGKIFPEGIGTHAPSKTVFYLQKQFERFSAFVSLDDESLCSDGVLFSAFVDNKKVFDKKLWYNTPESIALNLENAEELRFETNPLASKDCDHVDILLPLLYTKK